MEILDFLMNKFVTRFKTKFLFFLIPMAFRSPFQGPIVFPWLILLSHHLCFWIMTKALSMDPVKAVFFAQTSVKWFPLASVSYLDCPGTLIIPRVAGRGIASNKFRMEGPFFILSAVEVRESHCFHNIPKSWATPKAYQLSVQMSVILPFVRIHA